MFIEAQDYDDYFYEGSLTFGSISVEEFDRPDINEILFQVQQYLFDLQDVVSKMQLVSISSVFRIRNKKSVRLKNICMLDCQVTHNKFYFAKLVLFRF